MENKVLIADDDPNTRSLLAALAKKAGFSSESVSDGQEVLQKLRDTEYAAVILDLLMPRVNGFEVLQHLKALRPEMLGRTIVFTAASDQTLRYFDSTRVYALVHKPAQTEHLIDLLRSCAQPAPAMVSA